MAQKRMKRLTRHLLPFFQGSRLSHKTTSHYSPYIEAFPEHIPTISVDDFLQRCATQLGIRVDNPSKSAFFLPLGCDEEHIVTVKLPSLTHSESVETFRVYDPNEKLMRGQIFSPSDKAEGGTRQVGFYSINGKRALCAKKNPEAPGQERAVEILNKLLFEENDLSLVPKSMTISMSNEIFLISEYIEGETLEDAMNENSQNSHYMKDCKFNTKYFQQAILLSFLINPEDGRAQNYLIREIRPGECQLILIDNDRSLGEESVQFIHPTEGLIETRVHCALLSFHEMFEKNVQLELLTRFNELTKDDISKLMGLWALACRSEDIYQRNLQRELTSTVQQKSILGVAYDNKLIKKIKKKIFNIKEALHTKSFGEVLHRISPELAHIYQIPTNVSEDNPVYVNSDVEKSSTDNEDRDSFIFDTKNAFSIQIANQNSSSDDKNDMQKQTPRANVVLYKATQRLSIIDPGRSLGGEAPLSSYVPLLNGYFSAPSLASPHGSSSRPHSVSPSTNSPSSSASAAYLPVPRVLPLKKIVASPLLMLR